MEKEHKLKRTVYPYIILAIILVSAALILAELWANVGPLVPHPWEGPTATATLWWRTPKATTSSLLATGTPAALSMQRPLQTPMPDGRPAGEAVHD